VTLQTLLIIVMLTIVVVLAVGWWVATRVKRDIDEGGAPVGGAPRTVTVRSACALQLARISSEPLLVKREESDLKYQVEDKALKPLASLADRRTRAALREAAVAVDAVFGPRWTAIIRVSSEAGLTVTRLS